MSTDDNNNNNSTQSVTTVIIKRDTGNALGIAAFVFGVLSIFFLAPVFVPPALLLGIIAVIKKQLVWGTLGLVCALIGFLTSPILLAIFGLATLGSIASLDRERSQTPTAQVQPRTETNTTRQHTQPAAVPEAAACARESSSRSHDAIGKTSFTISNKTTNNIIGFWLDYQGNRQRYFEVGPGQSLEQGTYTMHPWLITDSSGKCLRLFNAAATHSHVLITK